MQLKPISQCNTGLDFQPRVPWSEVLPPISWRGYLIAGFEHPVTEYPAEAMAVELPEGTSIVKALTGIYTELGLGELARLCRALKESSVASTVEQMELVQAYGLKASDRLTVTLELIAQLPCGFQNWMDEKKLGARELSPLLALSSLELQKFETFLNQLAKNPCSKSEGVRILELGVELFLMGQPLEDLLRSPIETPSAYQKRLEIRRKPLSAAQDEAWQKEVSSWPWPAQTQGQWQRFGDQSGLDIKIRSVSPADLQKKVQRLISIGELWSCKI